MGKELLEQFQTIIDMMGKMATKEDIHDAEIRINTKIERTLGECGIRTIPRKWGIAR